MISRRRFLALLSLVPPVCKARVVHNSAELMHRLSPSIPHD